MAQYPFYEKFKRQHPDEKVQPAVALPPIEAMPSFVSSDIRTRPPEAMPTLPMITPQPSPNAPDAPMQTIPAIMPQNDSSVPPGLADLANATTLPPIMPTELSTPPQPPLPDIAPPDNNGFAQLDEGEPPPIDPTTLPPGFNSPPPILTRLQKIERGFDEIAGKDYSKGIYIDNKTGKETDNPIGKDGVHNKVKKAPGKDRSTTFGTARKIGNGLRGALRALANGQGIIGAIYGAVEGGMDRDYGSKIADQDRREQLLQQYAIQSKIADFNSDEALKTTNIENNRLKPVFEQQKIDIRRQSDVNKVLLADRKIDIQVRKEQRDDELKGNKWHIDHDDKGKMWKVYENRTGTGKPEREPFFDETGEQAVKAQYKMYKTITPEGREVEATGAQILGSDTSLAVGNANRDLSAGKTNSVAVIAWQKEVDDNAEKRRTLNNQAESAGLTANNAQTRIDKLKQDYPNGEAAANILTLEKERDAAKIKHDEFVSNALGIKDRPKPDEVKAAVVGGDVKFSESEIRSRMKGKFTQKEIDAKVEEAKDTGRLK